MSCTDVDRSRSALFETTFGIADNDTLDDEVLEVIRKAKEEAILDKKFGLMIKEEDGNCSDGNNKGKVGVVPRVTAIVAMIHLLMTVSTDIM